MILNKKRPLKDNIYPYISQKTTTFALVLRKVKHVRFFKTHHKYIYQTVGFGKVLPGVVKLSDFF